MLIVYVSNKHMLIDFISLKAMGIYLDRKQVHGNIQMRKSRWKND